MTHSKHENLLTLSCAAEVDVAIEFGDGTQFTVGQTVWHDHVAGKYRRVDLEDNLDSDLANAIRQNRGYEEDDASHDGKLAKLSEHELLDAYLQWEGICGFTGAIISALDSIRAMKAGQ